VADYKRIAIIPARGGSKRVPGKNLVEIHGKPLLAYTIETALKWNRFDEVYVNSENQAILMCGSKFGARTYKRPYELSIDKAKVLDVVKEQISTMRLNHDVVVGLLLPTCPLCSNTDLEAAYTLFTENEGKAAVVSVTEYEKAPEQALIINKDGLLSPKYPEQYSSKSQDHDYAYRYNTALIFNLAGSFLKQTDIIAKDSIPYIMPYDKSIDVDYDYQVKLIEILISHNKYNDERYA